MSLTFQRLVKFPQAKTGFVSGLAAAPRRRTFAAAAALSRLGGPSPFRRPNFRLPNNQQWRRMAKLGAAGITLGAAQYYLGTAEDFFDESFDFFFIKKYILIIELDNAFVFANHF